MADIYARLTPIFREVFHDDRLVLTPELHAKDVDGWDSFAHINLIVAVEHAFDVQFTAGDLISMTCVGDIVEILAKRTRPDSLT